METPPFTYDDATKSEVCGYFSSELNIAAPGSGGDFSAAGAMMMEGATKRERQFTNCTRREGGGGGKHLCNARSWSLGPIPLLNGESI